MASSKSLYTLIESKDGRKHLKVNRMYLESIVYEELGLALDELADDEDPADKPKGKSQPGVVDASKNGKVGDRGSKGLPAGSRARPDPVATPEPRRGEPDKMDDDDQEVPNEEDPADDEIADDKGSSEAKLGNEMVGKTIQSITMEPKSKLVAGAQELVITFSEIADPLKIIITKSGEVRFFFRGGLHNLI